MYHVLVNQFKLDVRLLKNKCTLACENVVQSSSVITNSAVNEHSVITNIFSIQIGHFSTQINPVITNKNGMSTLFVKNRVRLYTIYHEVSNLSF